MSLCEITLKLAAVLERFFSSFNNFEVVRNLIELTINIFFNLLQNFQLTKCTPMQINDLQLIQSVCSICLKMYAIRILVIKPFSHVKLTTKAHNQFRVYALLRPIPDSCCSEAGISPSKTMLSHTKWPDSFALLNSILDKNGSKFIPFKISFVNTCIS